MSSGMWRKILFTGQRITAAGTVFDLHELPFSVEIAAKIRKKLRIASIF